MHSVIQGIALFLLIAMPIISVVMSAQAEQHAQRKLIMWKRAAGVLPFVPCGKRLNPETRCGLAQWHSGKCLGIDGDM